MASQPVASPGITDPVQRFFHYFQLEATALQDQMARLEDIPTIGGERMDAIDHCLAGISRLRKEVQDAASYTSAYDQRIYSEGIKALYEKLEQTRTALAPKSKFTFKSSVKKNSSAISLTDAAELAKQQGPPLLSPRGIEASSGESSANQTPSSPSSPQPDVATATRPEPLRRGSLGSFLKAAGVESPSSAKNEQSSAVRKMSFASSNSVHISSHSGVHIILPSSAAHATSSGSLISLRHCIVDMSTPTATGQPFAALTVKDVKQSLLICGHVSGAAHITNVRDSVIRVHANQFRMHDCQNCIVYLSVRSRPVIENCSEIHFAAPPQPSLRNKTTESAENKWDQVQDFNWPKASPSPNWKKLPSESVVDDNTWSKIAEVSPEWSLDDILKVVGVAGLVKKAEST